MMGIDFAALGEGVLGKVAGMAAAIPGVGKNPAKKAYKLQRKLLQHQIPDMVAGAVEAGIHPLAALGVNPASGPVSAVLGEGGQSDMGTGVIPALMQSMEERSATQVAMDALQLKQVGLQNDLLQAQIGSIKARTLGAAGRTAEGTTRIGNINVSDPKFGQKVNDAWDDWVSGPAGALRALTDWWNTSWKRQPIDSGIAGGSVKLPPAASVPTMDLPRGGLY